MPGKTRKNAAAVQPAHGIAVKPRGNFFQRLGKDMRKNWILYVMILPVVVYYVIFAYMPMYGIQLAFKD